MKKAFYYLVFIAAAVPVLLSGQTSSHSSTISSNQSFSASGTIIGPGGAHSWSANSLAEAEQMYRDVLQAAQAAIKQGAGGGGIPMPTGNFGNRAYVFPSAQPSGKSPALICIRPMESATRAALIEDMKVMDKLLRDEISRLDIKSPRQAMGIPIWLTERSQTPPMFVEEYGVLFSYETSMPLSGSPKTPAVTNKTSSAWEQARKEVIMSGQTNLPQSASIPAADFDSERLNGLVNATINIMAEAKNIRSLKPEDRVTVTISGADEAGNPQRLTLKVTKADIDQWASGKLSADEFAKKVSRNLG